MIFRSNQRTICADAWNQSGIEELAFSCRSAASGHELNDADIKMAIYKRTLSFEPGILKREANGNRLSEVRATTLRSSMGDNQTAVVVFAQNTRNEVRKINGDGAIASALAARQGMKQQNYLMCLTPEHPQTHRVYDATSAWPSVCANDGKAGQNQQSVLNKKGKKMKAEVRRLTPKECERLMGFTDDYTSVMGSESSRYAACGNSWAANCARVVLKGIHRADEAVAHSSGGKPKAFKYGTISSGVECHTIASLGLGDKAVFYSEISPAPVALLQDHYPEVPILGDMTLVDFDAEKKVVHNRPYQGYTEPDEVAMGFKPYKTNEPVEIPCEYGEIDLVSGGTPCQSFSVAGKRAGGAEGSGTRSALAFQLPRIGKAVGARWLLWENVPGAFSSAGGRDFAWFIYRVMEAGYSIAWRTLDAQFVRTDTHPRAVPQRRRRIWLVAYKGGDWRVPCEALFEPMKVLGTEPPFRTVGIGFTPAVSGAVYYRAADNAEADKADAKTEIDEFREFLESADRGILDVLVKAGVTVSSDERIAELKCDAMKGLENEMDLFGGDLFGANEPVRQGCGICEKDLELNMPDEPSIAKVGLANLYEWARTVSESVCYCGTLFSKKDVCESDATVGDLSPQLLANIGNAGILSQGICVTMKMPEWNAGVTKEELASLPSESAELYDGDVCGLSDVLEDDTDPKYRLSWRACYGILNRAVKRGKKLPIELGYALVERIIEQASFVKWQMENGKCEVNVEGEAKSDKLSEREIARLCFETFVSFAKRPDEVEAIDPKSVGIDADCDAEDEVEENFNTEEDDDSDK